MLKYMDSILDSDMVPSLFLFFTPLLYFSNYIRLKSKHHGRGKLKLAVFKKLVVRKERYWSRERILLISLAYWHLLDVWLGTNNTSLELLESSFAEGFRNALGVRDTAKSLYSHGFLDSIHIHPFFMSMLYIFIHTSLYAIFQLWCPPIFFRVAVIY